MAHLMMWEVSALPSTFAPKLLEISPSVGSRAPKSCHRTRYQSLDTTLIFFNTTSLHRSARPFKPEELTSPARLLPAWPTVEHSGGRLTRLCEAQESFPRDEQAFLGPDWQQVDLDTILELNICLSDTRFSDALTLNLLYSTEPSNQFR